MMNHYRTRPLRTALLVYAAVIALLVTAGAARAIVQALPMLLVAGLIVAAAIVAARMQGRDRRGSAALRSEVASLQVEVEQLRHELAHARESAEQAWDAAAGQPPRPRSEPGDTARLLIDQPFSGVRPLTGAEDGWR